MLTRVHDSSSLDFKHLSQIVEMSKISTQAYWSIVIKSPTIFFDLYLHVVIFCLGWYLLSDSEIFNHYDAAQYQILNQLAEAWEHGAAYISLGLAGLLLDLFLLHHRLSRVFIRGCESLILILWMYSLMSMTTVPVGAVLLLVMLVFSIMSLLRV